MPTNPSVTRRLYRSWRFFFFFFFFLFFSESFQTGILKSELDANGFFQTFSVTMGA